MGDMPLRKNNGSSVDASRSRKHNAGRLVSALGGISTHSTGAEIASLSFARLKAWLDASRPVNSALGFY
jgi:predicted flavoprotein YhiN